MDQATGTALVTVVFEPEIALLHLQARSFAAHLPDDLATEIIVLDNTAHGLPARTRTRLDVDYGRHGHAVRVLRPDDVCRLPAAVGWRSQQVLKLEVAKQLASPRYIALDAKNHLVATLRRGSTESPDGRARVGAYSYENHRLRPDLEHVLGYLGLPAGPLVHRFPATVTPFVLDTALVRELIADVERTSGRSFPREFVQQDLTEFFLYSGWLLRSGRALEDVFDLQELGWPTIWPRGATDEGIAKVVREATDRGTPFFAVHRRALAGMDGTGRTALAAFWAGRGLFPSVEEAERFITDFQARHRGEIRRQQLRDLPGKVSMVPRRVRRRFSHA